MKGRIYWAHLPLKRNDYTQGTKNIMQTDFFFFLIEKKYVIATNVCRNRKKNPKVHEGKYLTLLN